MSRHFKIFATLRAGSILHFNIVAEWWPQVSTLSVIGDHNPKNGLIFPKHYWICLKSPTRLNLGNQCLCGVCPTPKHHGYLCVCTHGVPPNLKKKVRNRIFPAFPNEKCPVHSGQLLAKWQWSEAPAAEQFGSDQRQPRAEQTPTTPRRLREIPPN